MWKEISFKLKLGDINELEMLFLEVTEKVKNMAYMFPDITSQLAEEHMS